jgi:ribosomal protein S3AE
MLSDKKKKNMRKEFFEVSVPYTSTKVQLYAYEEDELIGKTVTMDMTRSTRGKNIDLCFRVVKENDVLVGVPFELRIVQSYVKKIVRRGVDYVEDSFEAECRDVFARIKPLLLTRNKVSRAVRNALRKQTQKIILSYVKTRTSQELFSDILTNKIQKQLIPKLKKIYPLAACEIRMFRVLRANKNPSASEEIVEENQ